MSGRFEIPRGEFGVVRVFEVMLDDPAEQAAFLDGKDRPDWPVARALVARDAEGREVELDRSYIDAIPAGALKGVGLSTYLAEGIEVDPAELEAHRTRLDAISRPVVLVLSRALGEATVLEAKPPLHWIGTFGEETPPPVFQERHTIEGSVPPGTSPDAPRFALERAWLLVVLAALAAFVVAWLLGGSGA